MANDKDSLVYGLAPTSFGTNSGSHVSDSDVTDRETRKDTVDAQDPNKHTRKWSTKACELVVKVASQLTRLKSILDIEAVASTLTAAEGVASLKAQMENLTQEWHQFSVVHDYLATNATEEFLQHPYIKDGAFDVAHKSYLGARTRLSTLIHSLYTPAQKSAQRLPSSLTLAPLNITPFSGDYAKWPEFRDTFTKVVINRVGLEDDERLYYLKKYLTGKAAQVIAKTTMSNESFSLAWGAICKRYEVPRLLIDAQLDKLLNLPTLTTRSAKQLYSLIDQTHEAIDALAAQKVDLTNGDCCLLTRLIISKLDRSTREAWVSSLGASSEFPKLRQLRQFLKDRARAEERYEARDHQKSSRSSSRSSCKANKDTSDAQKATSRNQQLSVAPTPPREQPKMPNVQYPCDLCNSDHYVVRCDQFGKMTPRQRAQVVIQHRLCLNCLGHHRVDTCKSKQRCKVCQGDHHSMIHPGISNTLSRKRSRSLIYDDYHPTKKPVRYTSRIRTLETAPAGI